MTADGDLRRNRAALGRDLGYSETESPRKLPMPVSYFSPMQHDLRLHNDSPRPHRTARLTALLGRLR
jgi:hypothetical protein